MDFGICQKISSYITRPPRTRYLIDDLGPEQFSIRHRQYERLDFTVMNQRQQQLESSLFRENFQSIPLKVNKQTVIFLHANSSSRLSAKNYLAELLPFFNVACLDCSGSGNSQGDFVTLGYYEKEDLRALIKTLKKRFGLDKFFLWGRSMGAVTALLYAAKYGDLLGIVADNAFSDLQMTCKELKDNYFPILPDFLLDTLLQQTQEHIDANINKPLKLQFSISKLKPIEVVDRINCPIFYIYSENDKIVPNYHTKNLYEKSNYPKRIMSVKGDHNGIRDVDIKGKVLDYLLEIINQNKEIMREKSLSLSFKNFKEDSIEKRKQRTREQKSAKLKIQQQINFSLLQYDSPFNEFLCKSYLKSNNTNQCPQKNSGETKQLLNFIDRDIIYKKGQSSEQKPRSSLLSSFGDVLTTNLPNNNQRKRRKIFEQMK